MALERIESEGHPALRMTLRAPREGLELGPMSLPARGEVLARVEADCSEACLLDVAWRSSGSSKYLRRDRATIALEAGRTVRVFTLPSLGSDAFLLVRPRENGVTVTLHAFSLRATQ
jgi:hypothetical protein